MALIYMAVAITGIVALCSLAVDWGRVQIVKAELQRAVDAAARAAASGLAEGGATVAQNRAVAIAAANRADGQPVRISAADVAFVARDEQGGAGGTFRALAGADRDDADGVRVTARRQVRLLLGQVIGRGQFDVEASATATAPTEGLAYAIAGGRAVTMSGNATVDSYDSTDGPYTAAGRRGNGDVTSGGPLSIGGNTKIYGDAEHVGQYTRGGNAAVVPPGTVTQIASGPTFPPTKLPASYVAGGAFNKNGNGTTTLAGGAYRYNSFSLSGNHQLALAGAVTLYVDGDVTLSGNVSTASNLPANLRIELLGTGTVRLSGNAALYADVYAPNGTIDFSGNGDFYGSLIGHTIEVSGNGKIHFDEALTRSRPGGANAPIKLVQ